MSDQTTKPVEHPFFGEVISTYTRAQAIDDGVLVDAGPMAKEAGFRWPVALTAAAWSDCVAWTDADSEAQVHQDPTGRLWDVLIMGGYAVHTHRGGGDRLEFSLNRVPRDGRSTERELVTLEAHRRSRRRRSAGHDHLASAGGLKPASRDWLLPLAAWVKAAPSALRLHSGSVAKGHS